MNNKEPGSLAASGKPRIFYGYIIVAAGLIIMLVIQGAFTSFGVFFNPIISEFGWLRATISGAPSIAFVFMGVGYIIMGALSDRFSPRIALTVGALTFGAGYLLMSQLGAVWQLYLFYPLVGMGVSASDVVILSTIVRWFVKKRGIMTGITKTGTGLGILIMPLLTSYFVANYGWRSSYIILGILVMVITITVSQFLRRTPEQMGLLPDGELKMVESYSDMASTGLSFAEAVRTRQLWMTCAAVLTMFCSSQIIVVHIIPHAIDNGIPELSAAGIMSIIGGTSILGRIVMGYANDRIGSRLALTICCIIFVVSFIWLLWAKELWMLYLFALVYGFGHGGLFAIVSPLVATMFGTRSHGTLLGIVFCCAQTAGAIGPLLAGYIFDVTGSYQIAFFILIALSVIGLMISSALRPMVDVKAEISD
ncbi:MFS transporter [Chloroflexota bacterium]